VATLKSRVPAHFSVHGDTAAGRVRYQSVCIACHLDDGSGNEALGAPPLKTQYDWYMLARSRSSSPACAARTRRRHGRADGGHVADARGHDGHARRRRYIRSLQKEPVNGR
jgi:cytochrome c553